MAITKFGKTWWGNEWLQSLTHIDYDNRIPRGARYARNGSVLSVQIKGGDITARVQGSRRVPYTVKLGVSPFTQKEVDTLIDGIMAHPAIVAELLNRKLSPAVNDIASQNSLKVFPTSWRDLRMSCSCPDWAVPCKHIAAVIYKVGQEIDNNPFLIFELHGVDILAQLKRRGVSIDAQQAAGVPDWREAFGLLPVAQVQVPEAPQALPSFDFTRIAGVGEAITRLLPESPAFYGQGDFKKHYDDNAHRVAKLAKRLLANAQEADGTQAPYPLPPGKSVKLEASEMKSVEAHVAGMAAPLTMSRLLETLMTIPAEQLDDCDNSVLGLRVCCMLALHLAAKGNVVPVLGAHDKAGVELQWTPLQSDEATTEILRQANAFFAPGSVVFDGPRRQKLAPARPAWLATSCFLTHLVHSAACGTVTCDKVYMLFYAGGLRKFNDVGEQNVPGGIKSWIDHLALPRLRWRPVVLVRDEAGDGSEFQIDLQVRDAQQAGGQAVPLAQVFSSASYAATRYDVLRDVSLLSALLPGLDEYLACEARRPVTMSNADFAQFLTSLVPAMPLLGIEVLLPRSLRHVLHPRPSVSLGAAPATGGNSALRLDQLLQFNWQVAIGDQLVSPEEFYHLLGNAQGLVRFKQQYIMVTPADLKRLEKTFAGRNALTPGRMLQAALAGEYEAAPIKLSPQAKALIEQLTTLTPVEVPSEIRATLRPYQQRGYAWMYHNAQLGFGSILADDMGLGKTLQVITLLQKFKDEGALGKHRALVVAPTGLLANWQAELGRFAPALTVTLYHGQNRDLKAFDTDILLTSYGLVRSDIDQLKRRKWAAVVIDEAQNIKNSATAQSKAVRALKADVRIAMSGTPVENRLSEYWSIMDYANKGYLGSLKAFNQDYGRPIQQEGDKACAQRFRRITAPMMMRRLKTDKSIIADLPDKIENDELAVLTPSQAALYKQVVNESMRVIESIDENDKTLLFKRQGLVLQMILALKQICNHPAQYLKTGDRNPSLSGKAQMLLDLVASINDAGQKAIIFTQFREMGDLLVQFIAQATGVEPMFLHGGCSLKQRSQMVDRFQTDRTSRFFVLSLKAAGTGLNLTAATHVIHYDLWWNPAVEAQATDRAYRIGQHQNVMVHRFITRDTFEERINEMINSKRELAQMTVSTGENWIGRLSNKELRELFG